MEVGIAILSRYPITLEDQLKLPEGKVDEGRTALFASVDLRGIPVPFFTTQLTSAPDQSSLRCEQVSALASFVAERRTNRFPVIVTGDLNAESDSDGVWPSDHAAVIVELELPPVSGGMGAEDALRVRRSSFVELYRFSALASSSCREAGEAVFNPVRESV